MRVLLVDGNNVYARAWFTVIAQPKKAEVVKATVGLFKNMIVNLRRNHMPDKVIICWDDGHDLERVNLFPDYKKRPPKPNEYYIGITHTRKAIEEAEYTQLSKTGVECDDLLATLACYYNCLGDMVIIATDDKDMLQLLSQNIIIAHSKRGNIDEGRFRQEYGFEPRLFIDFLAIKGDDGDNIPGIEGIGDKGAMELIQGFGTIERIYANISSVQKKYVKKLQDGFKAAMISKKLVTLKMIPDINLNWLVVNNKFSSAQ